MKDPPATAGGTDKKLALGLNDCLALTLALAHLHPARAVARLVSTPRGAAELPV